MVAVGGHGDDPQTCAGGTLALFADQGHDVVALTLTGGPPPAPDANPEERSVKNRLNSHKSGRYSEDSVGLLELQRREHGAVPLRDSV